MTNLNKRTIKLAVMLINNELKFTTRFTEEELFVIIQKFVNDNSESNCNKLK